MPIGSTRCDDKCENTVLLGTQGPCGSARRCNTGTVTDDNVAQVKSVTPVTLGVTFARHENLGEIITFLNRRWKNQVHLALSSRFASAGQYEKKTRTFRNSHRRLPRNKCLRSGKLRSCEKMRASEASVDELQVFTGTNWIQQGSQARRVSVVKMLRPFLLSSPVLSPAHFH